MTTISSTGDLQCLLDQQSAGHKYYESPQARETNVLFSAPICSRRCNQILLNGYQPLQARISPSMILSSFVDFLLVFRISIFLNSRANSHPHDCPLTARILLSLYIFSQGNFGKLLKHLLASLPHNIPLPPFLRILLWSKRHFKFRS